MGWFTKRERESDRLLRAFLATDTKRIEAAATLDAKKQEIELRRLELEMEHIEALGEERRKDGREKEENRRARQEAAKNAREKRKANVAGAQQPEAHAGGCRVCKDPSSPYLSAEEIWWHGNGHQGAPGPVQWPQ
jgi:hypothetical protein